MVTPKKTKKTPQKRTAQKSLEVPQGSHLTEEGLFLSFADAAARYAMLSYAMLRTPQDPELAKVIAEMVEVHGGTEFADLEAASCPL